MVYCPKCGKQNLEDARYCNNCGASLTTGKDASREWDDRCGQECSGRGRTGLMFWGIIVVLIGLWVVFGIGISSMSNAPEWITDFDWGWIFAVVIGAAILIGGISLILRGTKR